MDLSQLMTPKSILEKEKHDQPYLLFPEDFPTFASLYEHREAIRDLILVPIKSDDMHKYYHSLNKEELIKSVNFNNCNILYMENQFPYMLASDVSQNLIWIKENTTDDEVNAFILSKIKEINRKVILFERPTSSTKFVKGSFPHIRHIHFWFEI